MRYVWIDAGQSPDPVKLKAHRITRCYFDARGTPQTTEFERGIYRVQSWDNAKPALLAEELSADVHRWGGDPYRQLAVHVNIEHASLGDNFASFIAAFIPAYRNLRPQRDTGLVIDGLQGGAFSPQLVAAINADINLQVLAEDYDGAMSPLGADNVRSNLVSYGVQRQRALVMYDGAALPEYWDGCAFTMGRLP